MRKALKGVLILFVIAIALAFMPVQQTMADETFTYNKLPNFTLTVPSWDNYAKSMNPGVVVRKCPDISQTTTFEAAVNDLPEGKTYKKDAAKDLEAFFVDNYNAKSTEILYERDIKLKDGTPAYEAEVKWQYPTSAIGQNIFFYAYEVVANKGKKVVTVSVTSNIEIEKKEGNLKQYPLSLKFK